MIDPPVLCDEWRVAEHNQSCVSNQSSPVLVPMIDPPVLCDEWRVAECNQSCVSTNDRPTCIV